MYDTKTEGHDPSLQRATRIAEPPNKPETVLKSAHDRIESALIACHDYMTGVENKIDAIHSRPEKEPGKEEYPRDKRTFIDSMTLLAEKAEYLKDRINRARTNLGEII